MRCFIVEGYHDGERLKAANIAGDYYCTNGSRVTGQTWRDLERLRLQYSRLYLLVDPDESGRQIAAQFAVKAPYIPSLVLDPQYCQTRLLGGKIKIGVQHADLKYLHRTVTEFLLRQEALS